MKRAVFRERNKGYYRVLHTPIWIWVFWVLPGWPLTYDLYTHGPDRRHVIWLAVVAAIVAWRQANGKFSSVDQLADVDGIGPTRLDKLRALVRV